MKICVFSFSFVLIGLVSSQVFAGSMYFNDLDDTYISENTNANYGSSAVLKANKNYSFWNESLLRVNNIFGPGINQVHSTDSIISAELHLWFQTGWGGENSTFSLYQLDKTWSEATVTSGNYGRLDSSSLDLIDSLAGPPDPKETYYDIEYVFDVTASLISWQSDPNLNHGWGLTGSTARNEFYSSESGMEGKMPYLVVNAQPGEPVPEPITALLLGAGLAGLVGIRKRINKT